MDINTDLDPAGIKVWRRGKNIAFTEPSIIFHLQPQNISCAGHKLEVPLRSKEIFSELENQRFCKSDKILLFMRG